LIIYCYFLYPFFLGLVARYRYRPVHKSLFQPTISILMAVYNEEDVIERKIKNLLTLDYPQDKMEILIASDGSTDETNAIAKKFTDKRLHFFENNVRRGKIKTIQGLVQRAKNDILVFNDARQLMAPDAVKQLVDNFADVTVGCASGELIFLEANEGTAQGINLYWRYEKYIRGLESRLHSMMGATGAIYAIRRELYPEVPSHVILDDMFIPFKIIQKGYRAIYDETAKAYDEVANDPKEEHRRKARTLFGNYQLFTMMPQMFNPFRSPIAIQLFSHKFLRLMVPFLMIFLFFINALWLREGIYKGIWRLQFIFYTMALIGGLARNHSYGILKGVVRLCYIPYVFCLLNFSALVGFFRFIFHRQEVTWEKARERASHI